MPDLTYTQRMERFVEYIAPVIVSHLVKMRRELSEKQADPPPLQLLPNARRRTKQALSR